MLSSLLILSLITNNTQKELHTPSRFVLVCSERVDDVTYLAIWLSSSRVPDSAFERVSSARTWFCVCVCVCVGWVGGGAWVRGCPLQ